MDDAGYNLLRIAVHEATLTEFVTQYGLTPMAQLAFELRPDRPDDGTEGAR